MKTRVVLKFILYIDENAKQPDSIEQTASVSQERAKAGPLRSFYNKGWGALRYGVSGGAVISYLNLDGWTDENEIITAQADWVQ